MRYPSLPVIVASLVLAVLCVAVPLTAESLILILLAAALSGALCTYLHATPSTRAISLEKSALLGASVGLIGGLVAFAASVLGVWKAGNLDVIFNARSLNLAVVGLIKLALASGAGGLTVGLVSRVRLRRAVVKEE